MTDMQPLQPFEPSLYTRDGLRKYLTGIERSRFIATARMHPRREVRTLCLLVVFTGCRISEALALTRQSFDLVERAVVFRSLKKRGRIVFRAVPLCDDVLDMIAGEDAFDTGPSDRRIWSWSRGQAWLLVKQVMQAAGIDHGPWATPKGLRHTFGVHAVQSKVPLNLVQRWLGHSRLSTTAIYADALGAEEREIASLMWQS